MSDRRSGVDWEYRCARVEELVRAGATISEATYRVTGGTNGTQMRLHCPDSWARIKRLSRSLIDGRKRSHRASSDLEVRRSVAHSYLEPKFRDLLRMNQEQLIAEAAVALVRDGWPLESISSVLGREPSLIKSAVTRLTGSRGVASAL